MEAPQAKDPLKNSVEEWERVLLELVGKHSEYDPPDAYCLRDTLKSKYSRSLIFRKRKLTSRR